MTESSKQEIESLEAELAQAMLHNDVVALDRLIVDEAIFTDPQGSVINKAQDLALHQAGILVVTTYEIDDLTSLVLDSTAVTNMKVKVVGTFKNEPFEGIYRYTRTYLKQNEQWRIITAQATAITS
jgi:ketosteroid isomerase-like protein